MRSRLLRTVLATAACCVLVASATAPAHAAGRTTVADTQPAWATPANLARPADSSDRMAFSVWLGWRDPGGLDATLAGAAAARGHVRRPVLALLGRAGLGHIPEPVRAGHAAAMADLRVHAGPDRFRLRDRPAPLGRPGRPRPDDRDHRRLLLAHD